jgi:Uma2 family endonuclease
MAVPPQEPPPGAPFRLPTGRSFTVDDLDGLPDDGNRYELIDGTLLVSPAPSRYHQRVVYHMHRFLEDACPDEFDVMGAPFKVQTSSSTELQPDVLVAWDADLTDKLLPVAPVLVVEVLSPSTALNDLNNKKAAYLRMGVPSYWVVDPEEPRLTVFERGESGEYEVLAEVKDEDVFEAVRPFPVRIVPARLVGRLRG